MSIPKLFLIFSLPNFLFSQEQPKIDTDRPDQTECTSTVPKGYFQMENGFTFITQSSNESNFLIPSSLWKLGINDRFELRMITEPELTSQEDYNQFYLAPIRLGFKSRLVDGNGLLPNISFIGHLSVPYLSTTNARESNFNPDFRFTMDNTISNKLSIGYNLGIRWEDGNPEPIFQYTTALGYSIAKKWKCYVEVYGDKAQNSKIEVATSAGIYYYPQPNVMFDFTPSFGLVNSELKHYFGLGFSFLIPVKKAPAK